MRNRARRHDVPMFAGRTTPYGRDRPLAPFRDVVAEALGIEPDAGPGNIRPRLQALAELGLGPRQRRVLGGLFAVDIGARAPRGQPGQVVEAAVAFVRGLSAGRPLLMALEDVQHLEKDERELLARVIESCGDRPVVFILTSRTRPPDWVPRVRWSVRLDRLGPGRIAAVAADAVGASILGDGLRAVIAGTCEGNPLYAQTLAQALEAAGRLEREGGRVELRDRDTPPSLPPGLDGLIAARVDALPTRLKAALQVAATIGPRFAPALLEAATGTDDVDAIIEALARHHLVQTEEHGGCAFVSSLVWEAVRRGILAARQRDCHGMVANGIASLHRDDLDAHRLELANTSPRRSRRGRSWATAAAQLEDQQLVHHAARTWAAAVRWLGGEDASPVPAAEEAWMRLRAGETYALSGEPRRAEVHLQVALDLAEDALLPEAECRAHLGLGLLARGQGQADRSKRHLEAAWQVVAPRVAGPVGTGWEREVAVRASDALGRVLHEAGDLAQARSRFEEACRLAEGDAALEAQALAGLALQPIRTGDAPEALRLLERARGAAERGDRILLGKVVTTTKLSTTRLSLTRGACRSTRPSMRQGSGIGKASTNLHNVDTLRGWARSRAWAASRMPGVVRAGRVGPGRGDERRLPGLHRRDPRGGGSCSATPVCARACTVSCRPGDGGPGGVAARAAAHREGR